MAQLHQVIGAILRDIAQARVTSDVFSAEAAKAYEENQLMRAFPIPRAEIREVAIELKFAVATAEIDPERNTERGTKIAAVCDRYGSMIAGICIDMLKAVPDEKLPATMDISHVPKPEFLLELKREMSNFFGVNAGALTHGDHFLERAAAVGLLPILHFRLFRPKMAAPMPGTAGPMMGTMYMAPPPLRIPMPTPYPMPGAPAATMPGMGGPAMPGMGGPAMPGMAVPPPPTQPIYHSPPPSGDANLDALRNAVDKRVIELLAEVKKEVETVIKTEPQEYKVEVEVSSDRLSVLPQSGISSLTLTTAIRNYSWSQVEQDDRGEPIRRLVPE